MQETLVAGGTTEEQMDYCVFREQAGRRACPAKPIEQKKQNSIKIIFFHSEMYYCLVCLCVWLLFYVLKQIYEKAFSSLSLIVLFQGC